jgi:hypothetical protein
MADERKTRVLSIRTADEVIARIDDFRRAQLAIPSQTEALRALVKLGFEAWKKQEGAAQMR